MECEKTFQIHLDPALIERFHDLLGRHEHISEQISFVEKVFEKKKFRGLPAWDCICSCEHRIRDTVAYLNEQILGTATYEYGSAFDFINFINNAATVIDCVDMLARIFGVDLTEENDRTGASPSLVGTGRAQTKNISGSFVPFARFIQWRQVAMPVSIKVRSSLPARTSHG